MRANLSLLNSSHLLWKKMNGRAFMLPSFSFFLVSPANFFYHIWRKGHIFHPLHHISFTWLKFWCTIAGTHPTKYVPLTHKCLIPTIPWCFFSPCVETDICLTGDVWFRCTGSMKRSLIHWSVFVVHIELKLPFAYLFLCLHKAATVILYLIR